MDNVLVLCHGNINRSALVSAVLAARGVHARQGGFVGPGRRVPLRVRQWAALHCPEAVPHLEAHRSRLVEQEDVDWAHRVVYMDGGQLRRLAEFDATRVALVPAASLLDPPAQRIKDPAFVRTDDPLFGDIMGQLLRVADALARE